MRTIRNFFAVMLMGLAFSAFQVDAQSRGGESRSNGASRSSSRSTSVARQSSQSKSTVSRQSSASRPAASVQNRPSSSVQSRPSSSVQNRPSSQNNRPSRTAGQSMQSRPVSPNGPSSSVKPSSANKPSVQVRPTAPSREVKPSSPANNRPQSGAVKESKPSNTVRQPANRPSVNRPGYRPGDKKPAQSPVAADRRPAQRPGAGSSFKPDHHRPPVQIRPDHRHDRPRIHPVHRDFIAFDRPSCFWSAHHHYFGHRVRVLPARARLYRHHGIAYYCYNDIWYRSYGGYYVVCRPPFGTVLAANIIRDMAWTAVRISYYNTVAKTYRTINENNEYIAQQNAIIAQNNATIAAQNQTIAMNQAQATAAYGLANDLGLVQSYAAANSEYFYQDGVFYAKAANGEYNVIVPPAGALVESLPEDYDMVTLGGNEYYKVDDTVYKVTLSEGKPYFEVLGQMYS